MVLRPYSVVPKATMGVTAGSGVYSTMDSVCFVVLPVMSRVPWVKLAVSDSSSWFFFSQFPKNVALTLPSSNATAKAAAVILYKLCKIRFIGTSSFMACLVLC